MIAVLWPAPVPAAENPHSTTPALPEAPAPRPTTDLYGDPLPPGAVARLGSVRLRHYGLADFFIRPDGRTARTVGRDGFLRTWDLATGRQTEAHALRGEFGRATGQSESVPVGGMARPMQEPQLLFSPDRRFLAAIFNSRVVVWDAGTGHELRALARTNVVMQRGRFSPNGQTLALLEHDRLVLLEWRSGREQNLNFRVGRDDNSLTLCSDQFSPDGRRLIVSNGFRNVSVHVYEVAGAGELFKLEECDHLPYVVSPDNKWLAVARGGQDIYLHLHDLATGSERGKIKLEGSACSIAFSPDGATVAISEQIEDNKAIVRLVDPGTRKERARYELNEAPAWMKFSPDGKRIACELVSGTVLVPTGPGCLVPCQNSEHARMTFSPDGRQLVGTAYDVQRLRVWDAATGREEHDHPAQVVRVGGGRTDRSPSFAVAPDSRLLAAGERHPGAVRLWNLGDGRLVRQLVPGDDTRWGEQLVFSADGGTLVAGDDSGALKYIDTRTGAVGRVIELEFPDAAPDAQLGFRGFRPTGVWVSPDLRWAVGLMRSNAPRALVRDLSLDAPVRPVGFPGDVGAWAWPNVAVWVAKERGAGLVVVSAVTGLTRVRLPGFYPWGGPVVFSPDGRLLAAVGEGHQHVVVREVATGRAVATVATGRVYCLTLAPDDRTLVTTGVNGLRVWDLATGRARTPHTGRVLPADHFLPESREIVFTPDGRRVVSNLADGTGLVWDLGAFTRERLGPAPDDAPQAALWADLESDDAKTGYGAVWRLIEAPPDATVRFLGERLKPVVGPDPQLVRRAIADLGHDDFFKREAAMGRLATLGPLVAADLDRAARGDESPEVRQRAGQLVGKWSDPVPKGETLRAVRAITALERIGTAHARKVLAKLAAGASGAQQTEEARAALARMDARRAKP
ncbi:WD40 repeat domain-containing protein [Frigoriglobus tundricola]|uniref:WD40 repeat domain-containing protein n=1 Tax=Frigoriglobus tundricola TaxID=2774151 RepID=UPI00148E9A05|nr:WD40 repeat domain-containing protein [Frigoriglobus tundricola]